MAETTKLGALEVLRDLAKNSANGDAHKVGHHYAMPWAWNSPPFGPKCKRPEGTYAVMRIESNTGSVTVADFPSCEQAEAEAARLNGVNEYDTAIAIVAELIAADIELDAAQDALCEAKREKGNWRVNPLSHNHPAVARVRAAQERRAAALAAIGETK